MDTGPAEARGYRRLVASWHQTVPQSPKLVLALLFLTIFLAALGVMNILHRIPAIPEKLDIILDSALLVLFVYPCVIFLVKRPYLQQIKARERTETALTESESRMRMILENSPYFMTVRDAAGVILMAGKVFADHYGTTAARMTGVAQAQIHRAAGRNEEDLAKILEADREVIETGEARFGLEKLTDGNGRVRWYRYARLPVMMPSGGCCVLAISGEVTRRIKVEDAMGKARAELERRVEERTAELARANRELTAAVEAYRATAEELSVSRSELRNLSAGLQLALEEERTRISRELHDELGQSLTALKFDLTAAAEQSAADRGVPAERTASMIQFVDSILATVKKISRELRPGILDDLGLAAAVEWQAKEFRKRTRIPCEVVVAPEEMTVDRERSTAVFRIFQEALTNVARHARATKVEAILESGDGALSLEVRDNGRGITSAEISGTKSLGIIGIRERVRWLGGEVRIDGSPGAGTVVAVTLPERKEGGLDASGTPGG
ncbi:MAG: histidine kinase [Gemmatimonadota bacterium]